MTFRRVESEVLQSEGLDRKVNFGSSPNFVIRFSIVYSLNVHETNEVTGNEKRDASFLFISK